MEDLIKLLDKNLEVDEYKILEDEIFIYVKTNRIEATCPYCKSSSYKVHSIYIREFKDFPILEKKSNIILKNRKFFCNNSNCKYKAFAETFEFLDFKNKKTKRLEEYIISISQNTNSLTAEKILKKNVVQVGKSNICNLLKKELLMDRLSIRKVCIYDFALKKRKIRYY